MFNKIVVCVMYVPFVRVINTFHILSMNIIYECGDINVITIDLHV